MLSYKAKGPLLILTAKGQYAQPARDSVLDAIGADPAVPNGAVLLVDIRELEFDPVATDGLRALIARLGPKLGTVCALVTSDARRELAEEFQRAAAEQRLNVGIFRDEPSAREWLAPFLRG